MRIFLTLLVMMWATVLTAQVPDITHVEYFFNTDPGVGNGVGIPITPGGTVTLAATVSTSGLAPGQHRLYVRTRDAGGTWSLPAGRVILVEAPAEPVVAELKDLNRIEYFFGTDPGFGSATALPVTGTGSTTIAATVVVSGLAPGFHQLHVRARDASGLWSTVVSRSVLVEAPKEPVLAEASEIDAIEYFFGEDPGFGQGSLLDVTPTSLLELDEQISSTGLAVGEQTIHFRARNAEGLWSPVLMREFAIIDVLDAISALTPFNNSTVKSIFPTLTWSSLPEATGYEVQVDISAAFDSESLFAEVLEDTTVTLGPLDYLTTYHWRVRPVDGTFNGPWTAARSFSTEFYNPDVPILVSPTQNATDMSTSPLLQWRLAARADAYEVQVSKTADFAQLVNNGLEKRMEEEMEATSALGSYLIKDLEHATAYFWRVRGSNEYGEGDWSEARRFTTVGPDDLPSATLATPADGAHDLIIPATLTWNPVIGASHYLLEVGLDSLFKTRIVWDSLKVTTIPVMSLSDTTTYYWRVRTFAEGKTEKVSEERSFRTELRLPETPIWSPVDGSADIGETTILTWATVARASTYDVAISRSSVFSDDSTTVYSAISGNTLEIASLIGETRYHWRVRGVNARGAGQWSTPLGFQTATSVNGLDDQLPEYVTLSQNFPNPFNPSTVIGFQLSVSGNAKVTVYDVLGRQVAVLVDGVMPAGSHTATFDATNLTSGVYVYRLEAGGQVITRKMLMVK